MRNARPTLALAALSIAALIAATTLHAQDARQSSGFMMGRGMMGGGGMMGGMSQMMDHCTGMMSGDQHGNRPNDQWRRNAPTAPDKSAASPT